MALQRPKEVKFDWTQPQEPHLPSQRPGAFIGPSGVNKTTTAIAMLTEPYKDVYSRVYVLSPSCAKGADPACDVRRKHAKKYTKVDEDSEQTMRNRWEPQTLEKIIRKHQKVSARPKADKNQGFVILAHVGDFADQGDRVTRSSTNVLTNLFVRGQHLGCVRWLLTQTLKISSLIIRANFCWVLCWKLRSAVERNELLGKLDALLDKERNPS
jgi:hypothetical protein